MSILNNSSNQDRPKRASSVPVPSNNYFGLIYH